MADTGWITVEEAAELDQISLVQAKRRALGKCEPGYVSRLEANSSGRMRRMVYVASLSLDGQERRREKQVSGVRCQVSGPEEADSDTTIQMFSGAKKNGSGQLSFLDRTEEDAAIEAVKAKLVKTAPSQIAPLLARYRAIQPLTNHDFSALGLGSKTSYASTMSRQLGLSARHFQRLRERYAAAFESLGLEAAIESLALNSPGPAKWTGSPLDPATDEGRSNIMYIQDCWEFKHLTRRQSYHALKFYLEEKQRGTGGSWVYAIPTEQAVSRFINTPPPDGLGGDLNPRRNGLEAIKAAAGHLDCTYDDEAANDTWCIDEWELDGAFYNIEKRREIFWSIYLVSVIDERTTRILDWTLAYHLNVETVLDLLERCVREFGPPLYLRSDQAGHFRGKVLGGGRAPLGPTVVQSRGKLLDAALGAMGQLGVQPVSPEGHNPRSNRIERMHGLYAERAQEDFGPSWRGSAKKEIHPGVTERQMSGIDERVARHIKEHCKAGTSGPLILSTADGERIVGKWVEEINLADTDAKGCHGMSRLAAYKEFCARRERPTAEMVDMAFAERGEHVILPGGIVEWRDKLRYSSPELIGRPGECVEMLRYRDDTSRIIVELDGQLVIAERRPLVGRNTPGLLSEEIEKLARIRKQVSGARCQAPGIEDSRFQVSDQDSPAGAHGEKALKKTHNETPPTQPTSANPSGIDVGARLAVPTHDAEAHPEISSVEWMAARVEHGYRPPSSDNVPPLHELEEFDPTMEEL
jgi:hypothetical protein